MAGRRKNKKLSTFQIVSIVLVSLAGLYFWRRAKVSDFRKFAESYNYAGMLAKPEFVIYFFEAFEDIRPLNDSDQNELRARQKANWKRYKKRKFLF